MRDSKKLVVAALLVDNGRDSYLTAPRADDMSYTFPGGKVETGETLVEAGVRELLEETGLQANPANLFFIDYADTKSKLIMFFYCPLWSGRLQNPEPHKHGDWRWYGLNMIPKNRGPGTQAFLDRSLNTFIRLRAAYRKGSTSLQLVPTESTSGDAQHS